jgi:hypothetical protein
MTTTIRGRIIRTITDVIVSGDNRKVQESGGIVGIVGTVVPGEVGVLE